MTWPGVEKRVGFNTFNIHAHIYLEHRTHTLPINTKSEKSSVRLSQVTKGSVHTSHVKAKKDTVIKQETKIRPSQKSICPDQHTLRQRHEIRQEQSLKTLTPGPLGNAILPLAVIVLTIRCSKQRGEGCRYKYHRGCRNTFLTTPRRVR